MAKSEIVFTFEDIKKVSLPQVVNPKDEIPVKQQNNLQGIKVSFNDSSSGNIEYKSTTPSASTTIFTESASLNNLKRLGNFSSTPSNTTPVNNFSTFEKTTTNVTLNSIKNPISKLAQFANIESQSTSSGGMIVYQGNKTLTDHKDSIDYSKDSTQDISKFTTPENFEVSTNDAKFFSATTTGKLISASIKNIVEKDEKGNITNEQIFVPKFVNGSIKTIESSTTEIKNTLTDSSFYKNTATQGISTSDNGFLNVVVNNPDSRKAWVKSFTLSDDSASVYNAKQTDAATRYQLRIAKAVMDNSTAIKNLAEASTQQVTKKQEASVLKDSIENNYNQTKSELDQRLSIVTEANNKTAAEYFNNLEKAQETFNKEIANSESTDEVETANKKYNDTVSELNKAYVQAGSEYQAEIDAIKKESEQAIAERDSVNAAIDKELTDAQDKVDKAMTAQAKTAEKVLNLNIDAETLARAEAQGLTMQDLNQTQLKYSESVGFQGYLSLNTASYGSVVRDDGWKKSFSSIFNKDTAKELGSTFADLGLDLLIEIANQNLNGWTPRNGKLAADSYERFKAFSRNVGYYNAIGFLDFDQYYYDRPSITKILGTDDVDFSRIKKYYLPGKPQGEYITDESSYTRTVRFIQDASEHESAVQSAKYDGVTSTARKSSLAIVDSNIFIEEDYEQPVADTILDHKPTKIDLVERALIDLVQPQGESFKNGYIHEMVSKNPLLSTSQYHLFIKPLKENNSITTAYYNDGGHVLETANVTGIKNLDKTTRWLNSTESHYDLDNQGNFANEKTHYSAGSAWKNFRIKGLPIGSFDRQSAGINYGVQILNLIPNLQADSDYKAEITIICDRALDELEYLNLITGVGIYKGPGDYNPTSKATKVFNLSAVSDSDYSYCDDAYLRIRNGRDLMKSLFAEELNRDFGESEEIQAIYYKVPVFHFHKFRIINTSNSFKFEHSNHKPLELKATVTWSRLNIDWEDPLDIYYSHTSVQDDI